ncbi:pseudoazurin [Paracoccus laeviglucosivorans]|uniref:Pseudoazurin n=1 Tax=Paracoccus laeviglucosivorans TaxID=1197861 RepID=A0A521CA67_9RHOB|nr:pseudoazurin [Paracoccus laeviglucosivorans]SMO56362.1 pseudoazurin [Paracoccus laeviglucosivorans]
MKAFALPLLLLTALPAWAETHEVHMLNRGETGPMVYEPAYLNIAPGDTVRFLPTQPSHNAATIDGMTPEGAEPFRSRINEPFEVTLTAPGTYGIKCSPHFAMGMVMLIQVGAPGEISLPDDLPKRARDRMEKIVAERG